MALEQNLRAPVRPEAQSLSDTGSFYLNNGPDIGRITWTKS
jgi:hypothetical protein